MHAHAFYQKSPMAEWPTLSISVQELQLHQETNPSLAEPDPRTRKTYFFQMTPVRGFITSVLKSIFPLFVRLHFEQIGQLPPEGPVILAANHMTNYDVIPVQICIDRPIFFMGKAELFQNPMIDVIFRRMGGFPVYRGERDEWAMLHAQEILQRGLVLGMFPEGTRSKGHGLRPAKTGVARLALDQPCPILPVAQYGTENMFHHFPKRIDVTVKMGALIYPAEDDTTLSLTDRLMFALAELLPARERGVYAFRPHGFS